MVDVARRPSRVRAAVTAFPDAHWVFVSTINVYADESTPGTRPGSGALRAPRSEDADLADDPDAYGPMKVAREAAVTAGAVSATVVRPGLIVGPGDPTGRFTYWPRRLADGAEVLAPGNPQDQVQVVDVRDLAAWVVDCCETRPVGEYDGVGPVRPIGDLLAEVAAGVGAADPRLTWVDGAFLAARGVEPWSGPEAVPLWLPRPAYDGMLAHDAQPTLDAGLIVRPVAETARDTLDWLRSTPDAQVTGLDRERGRAVLDAWAARS